jgi:hypothetical protein
LIDYLDVLNRAHERTVLPLENAARRAGVANRPNAANQIGRLRVHVTVDDRRLFPIAETAESIWQIALDLVQNGHDGRAQRPRVIKV